MGITPKLYLGCYMFFTTRNENGVKVARRAHRSSGQKRQCMLNTTLLLVEIVFYGLWDGFVDELLSEDIIGSSGAGCC